MPASNLAKVFGPTIIGYSSTEAEPMKMLSETTKQAKVGLLLRTTLYIVNCLILPKYAALCKLDNLPMSHPRYLHMATSET